MNYTGQTLLMAKLNDLTKPSELFKPCELTKPHELEKKTPYAVLKACELVKVTRKPLGTWISRIRIISIKCLCLLHLSLAVREVCGVGEGLYKKKKDKNVK